MLRLYRYWKKRMRILQHKSKTTEDNKLGHQDDELVQDKMTKTREVTDFMVI